MTRKRSPYKTYTKEFKDATTLLAAFDQGVHAALTRPGVTICHRSM